MYHDFQHSCIDVEICDSAWKGTRCIVIDSDCMAAMLSAAVGPEEYCLCLCSFGDGLSRRAVLKNRTIRRSTKQTKNYLRNTDHLKGITPNLNLNERLRDSPVPWHCRARCQLISFKAAMALRPCVQRWNLEDSSAARPGRSCQCGPARQEKFQVSRRKSHRIFLENSREKSGIPPKKSGFVIGLPHTINPDKPPKNYKDAMSRPDSQEWAKAYMDGYMGKLGFKERQFFATVALPKGAKVSGTTTRLDYKIDNGVLTK